MADDDLLEVLRVRDCDSGDPKIVLTLVQEEAALSGVAVEIVGRSILRMTAGAFEASSNLRKPARRGPRSSDEACETSKHPIAGTILASEFRRYFKGKHFLARKVPLRAEDFALNDDFIDAARQVLGPTASSKSVSALMETVHARKLVA